MNNGIATVSDHFSEASLLKAKLAPTEKDCAYRKILPSHSFIVGA
jgi:hypothetical protein